MDTIANEFTGLLGGLPAWKLAAVCLVVIFAGLVHGTLGLGFPLVATPLIALTLDVRTAILLTLMPTAVVNVASLVHGGNAAPAIRRHWPLVGAGALGAVLGTRALTVFDPEPFRLLLAALIVTYLLASRVQRAPGGKLAAHPVAAMACFGLTAGLAAGTTNVMVPVLIIYALETGLGRDDSVRVFNLCFLAGKLSQIATFAVVGVVGAALLLATTPLALAALLALLVGTRLRTRVPAETYRKVLRWLLALLALLLAVQYLRPV
jgi:uncharacterized membrane protein YfcA